MRDDFTNYQLVALVVALLDGDTDYIDRENIAIKVDEIAPGRFNWRKYPGRIDLDAVGSALRHAKKPNNGGLILGSNSRGWMLTSRGVEWIKSLDPIDVGDVLPVKHRKDSISANQEAECGRLRTTTAYQLFTTGGG